MSHCKSCSVTKTNTETEARDYVTINHFNVGGLYDQISPCTAACLDDEELCKQVRYVKKGWGRVVSPKALSGVHVEEKDVVLDKEGVERVWERRCLG